MIRKAKLFEHQTRALMNKKLWLLSLGVLGIIMCMNLVSAYTPYFNIPYNYPEGTGCGQVECGAIPAPAPVTGRYIPYRESPVRVGGFFGASSPFIIGLKPGVYQPPICNTRPAMMAGPCLRTGGWFGCGTCGYSGRGGGIFSFPSTSPKYTPYKYLPHGPL